MAEAGYSEAERTLIKTGIAAVAAVLGLVAVGVAVSTRLAVALVVGMAIMAYLTGQSKAVSIPFGISFVAVVLVLTDLSPDFISTRLPDIGPVVGIDLAALDSWQFALIAVLVITAIYIVDIRFLRKSAVKPDTVASRVAGRWERLVGRYITITRIIAGFALALVFMAMSEAGVLLGEIGAAAGEAPMVVSNLANITLVHLSLGGSLPFVGPVGFDVTPTVLVGIMVAILLAAAAVKFNE